ncbi:hypothetical protein PAPHI01_0858 [Pancytospora philotis]|nr:hypothetical protein PAPHI01_0858 [Pancytospora philotis]
MFDFSFYERFDEIAVVFSSAYRGAVQSIYDDCQRAHPTKTIFLVHSKDILCALKCDAYESYIVVGLTCPLHPFKNAQYYEEELDAESIAAIAAHEGGVVLDSLYAKYATLARRPLLHAPSEDGADSIQSCLASTEHPLLVVTHSQDVLDYYNYAYERVAKLPNALVLKDRVKQLMKENINGNRVNEKKIFGIIFTSPAYEGVVDALHRRLNKSARAYKIFLKDISYERLISIDNIDCIVLVDCPLFQCDIRVHIPVISPFSVECGLSQTWNPDYCRNAISSDEARGLAINGHATSVMLQREYKGVLYRGTEADDMEIHTGRSGIASRYDCETD